MRPYVPNRAIETEVELATLVLLATRTNGSCDVCLPVHACVTRGHRGFREPFTTFNWYPNAPCVRLKYETIPTGRTTIVMTPNTADLPLPWRQRELAAFECHAAADVCPTVGGGAARETSTLRQRFPSPHLNPLVQRRGTWERCTLFLNQRYIDHKRVVVRGPNPPGVCPIPSVAVLVESCFCHLHISGSHEHKVNRVVWVRLLRTCRDVLSTLERVVREGPLGIGLIVLRSVHRLVGVDPISRLKDRVRFLVVRAIKITSYEGRVASVGTVQLACDPYHLLCTFRPDVSLPRVEVCAHNEDSLSSSCLPARQQDPSRNHWPISARIRRERRVGRVGQHVVSSAFQIPKSTFIEDRRGLVVQPGRPSTFLAHIKVLLFQVVGDVPQLEIKPFLCHDDFWPMLPYAGSASVPTGARRNQLPKSHCPSNSTNAQGQSIVPRRLGTLVRHASANVELHDPHTTLPRWRRRR
mmetsp:Transcript_24291/g.63730  ORF Transcript_24291/g.63730 Transcript_24291/m.63730 type:complete len:468 (+) Transcript_24291:328-1731(+)